MAARAPENYDVVEGTMRGAGVTVVIATIHTETRWRCPACNQGWRKRGRHLGTNHTCARCKSSFWLRPA